MTNCRSERNAYRNQPCQVCLSRLADDVHEIARGPARATAFSERLSWLAVCRSCHEAMGDYAAWPIERQLAVKLVVDAEHFDLAGFNELRGRAAGAITLADVAEFLKVEMRAM